MVINLFGSGERAREVEDEEDEVVMRIGGSAASSMTFTRMARYL